MPREKRRSRAGPRSSSKPRNSPPPCETACAIRTSRARKRGKHRDTPKPDHQRGELVGDHLEPFDEDDRCKSKKKTRHHKEKRPGDQQLRQADLGEQAAG